MLVEKNNEIQKLRQKYGKKNKNRGRSANPAMMRSSQMAGNEEDDQSEEGLKLGADDHHYDSSDSDSDSISGRKSRKSRFDKQQSSQFSQIDQTSRAYIKNVLLKYFEYQAEGLEKEMLMMEKVLFTVL
jgi:hypothetical protein